MESSDYVPRQYYIPRQPAHLTLQDLDPPVSDKERAKLEALIRAERPSDFDTRLHPHVDVSYTPRFTPLMEAELARLEAGEPKPEGTGIDTSRYTADALEPPPRALPAAEPERSRALEQWRATLRQAKVSAA